MAQLDQVYTPDHISTAALATIRRKAVFLNRITREMILERDLNGGNVFIVYKPNPVVVPPVADAAATNDLTPTATINLIPMPVTLTKDNYFRTTIKWDLWQSRVVAGGFKYAFNLCFGGLINGFVKRIEQDIASNYAAAANYVGAGNTALSDDTLRAGIKILADQDLTPDTEEMSLVVGTDAYWKDLLDDDSYKLASSRGDKASLIAGRLQEAYNVGVFSTPSVINSSGSASGNTTHNLLFTRDAMGIAFLKFEPVSTYVGVAGQNVEEGNITEDGISVRSYKWFDPNTGNFYLQMSMAFITYPLVETHMVDVRS